MQLAAHFIGLHTEPGDVVLDCFMGGGSTGVAAKQFGRRFIGIELDPKWFEYSLRRISDSLRQPDLFIEKPKPAKQESFL